MRHVTYLLVLSGCLALTVPLELTFRCAVLRRPLLLLLALLPELLIFGAWDLYAISAGQWTYDHRDLVGIQLPGHLPLEEAGFFLVIPICAILTFEAVQRRSGPPVEAEPALAEEAA
jgi:lycopene cyclase domain-containing protein